MRGHCTFALAGLLLPLVALANTCEEQLLTPCADDLSMVLIHSITGNLYHSTPQTVFGAVFAILNSLALSLGLLLILYTIITNTVRIANSGEFLSREGGVIVWVRVVLGLTLLVTLSSGFSNAQTVVYHVVKAGVGLADSVWSNALNHLDNNRFFIDIKQSSTEALNRQAIEKVQKYRPVLLGVWKGLMCSYRYNARNLTGAPASELSVFGFVQPFADRLEQSAIAAYEDKYPQWYGPRFTELGGDPAVTAISFGYNGGSASLASERRAMTRCGYLEIPSGMKNAVEAYAQRLYLPIIQPLLQKNILSEVQLNAEQISVAILAMEAITQYEDAVQNEAEGRLAQQYADFGWAVAGFYYNKIITVDAQTAADTQFDYQWEEPNSRAHDEVAFANQSSASFEVAFNAYKVSKTANGRDIGASIDQLPLVTLLEQETGGSGGVAGGFVSFLRFIGINIAALANLVYNGFQVDFLQGQDPFEAAKKDGQAMMIVSSAMLLTAVVGVLATMLSIGFCGGVQPAPKAFQGLMSIILAILFVLITGAYVQGALLGIFLPMIPVIIFVGGLIGWLFAVFEAFVAAPLLALGLVWPNDSGELWGRAEPGIMILLNIFLRPALMVVGLLSGIFLCWLGFSLLSVTFKVALSAAYIRPDGLFGWLPLGFAYAALLLSIAQKSFTLIFELPDKILIWLGGQVMSWGDADDLVGAAQQGVKEGSQVTDRVAQAARSQQGSQTQAAQQIKDGIAFPKKDAAKAEQK